MRVDDDTILWLGEAAVLAARFNQVDSADKMIDAAIEVSTGSILNRMHAIDAIVKMDTGRVEQAISTLKNVVLVETPDDENANMLLMNCLHASGEVDAGKDMARTLIESATLPGVRAEAERILSL